MFFIILLIIILNSIYVSYLHMRLQHNNLVYLSWTMIVITSAIMCYYLIHSELVFINGQLSTLNLLNSALDINYLVYFLQNILLLLVIAGIYYFLRLKLNIKPFWIMVALLIGTLIIYYPGVTSADDPGSYKQFLAHNYQLWQPPFFTIWWQIFHAHSAAFVMGTLIYYSSLIAISYILDKNDKNWQNDLLVLFCLNPLMFTQLSLDFKDVSFTGVLLAAVASYLYLLRVNNRVLKLLMLLIFYTCLFFAVGFRINGILTIVPLIFININYLLPKTFKYKIAITGILSLIIVAIFFIAMNFINKQIFKASDPHLQTNAMITDLTYIECNTNYKIQMEPFYFKNPEQVDLNQKQLCKYLNYQDSDFSYPGLNVWNTPTMIAHYPQIKHDWIKAISTYPLTYLYYRARFYTNILFFQYWYPTNTGTNMNLQNSLNKLAFFQHFSVKFLLSILLVAGTITCLFLCLYFKLYDISLALTLSNLFQLAGYYFLIPAHAARYFYWDYLCVILSLCLLTFNLCKKNKTNNTLIN